MLQMCWVLSITGMSFLLVEHICSMSYDIFKRLKQVNNPLLGTICPCETDAAQPLKSMSQLADTNI